MWSWLHSPAGEQTSVHALFSLFCFCIISPNIQYFVLYQLRFHVWKLNSGCEGPGQILIQTVKLAFSVTNNVIRLKPPSDVVSPLEQALTQHGGHGNNLIVVLAKYIYHKHDPALPRLAIQLLKRLATVRTSIILYFLKWWAGPLFTNNCRG